MLCLKGERAQKEGMIIVWGLNGEKEERSG